MTAPAPSERLRVAVDCVFALYHRAVETDDQSLLPEVSKQWLDIFFQHGDELQGVLCAKEGQQPTRSPYDPNGLKEYPGD
jgi:hypothetical protein